MAGWGSNWEHEVPIPPNAILPSNWRTVDPTRPWVPSPEPQTVALPDDCGENRPQKSATGDPLCVPFPEPRRSQDRATPEAKTDDSSERPKRRSRLSVFYWIDRLRSSWGRKPKQDKSSQTVQQLEARQVTPGEFKAYGYWARPRLGSIIVRNATPPPFPRHLTQTQVEAVMRSLRSPDGAMHPENWIPRLEHPALPPRPDLWSTPPSTPRSTPPPLPCEMQLNPLLQHRRTGLPMLDYDLRHRDLWVFVGPPQTLPAAGGADALKVPVSLELYGPNGAQPATYPGVGALNVTMLGDEPFAEFHWPFIVLSRHPALPITVQDVLEAVHENFRQCLTTEEVDMLGPFRRDQLFRTYWARVEWFPSDETAGLRRVDYLGDRYMFRGLEPAPVGDGFMIFFGPQR